MNKTNRIIQITKWLLLLVACGFFVASIILTVNAKKFQTEGKMTEALIVNMGKEDEDSGYVTLTYVIDEVQYQKTMHEYSSSWDVGDTLDIYYDVNDHKHICIKSMMYFLPILFGAFGLAFLIAGIVIAMIRRIAGNKQQRLMSEGRKVYATISEIFDNYKIRVNGRHPFRAKATYVDEYSGVNHEFYSANFWENDLAYVGQNVPVYMNPKNPKDYFMDLESLKKTAL